MSEIYMQSSKKKTFKYSVKLWGSAIDLSVTEHISALHNGGLVAIVDNVNQDLWFQEVAYHEISCSA